MLRILCISLIFLFGCLSPQMYKECQELQEVERAENEGRVEVLCPGGDDPYTYLVWRDDKGEIIKMARFVIPKSQSIWHNLLNTFRKD